MFNPRFVSRIHMLFYMPFKKYAVEACPSALAFSEVFESRLVNKNFVFTSMPTLKAPFLSHSLYSFPIGTYNGVHQSEKSESHSHLFTHVRQ